MHSSRPYPNWPRGFCDGLFFAVALWVVGPTHAGAVDRPRLELMLSVGHMNSILDLAVSPDGRFALSASTDGTLRVWELDTGRELRQLQSRPDITQPAEWVAFLPGLRAVSAHHDRLIAVWDLRNGRLMKRFRIGAPEERRLLLDFALASDGRLLAVSDSMDGVTVWDIGSGIRIARPGTNPLARCVASDDPTKVLLSCRSAEHCGIGPASEPGRNDEPIEDVAVPSSKDDRGASARCIDLIRTVRRPLRLWRWAFDDHHLLAYAEEKHRHLDSRRSALSDDGATLLTTTDQGEVRVERLVDGVSPAMSGSSRRAGRQVTAVECVADCRMALSGYSDGSLVLWDLSTGRPRQTLGRYRGATAVTALAISRRRQLVSVGGDDGSVRIWDLSTARLLGSSAESNDIVNHLAFAPHGDELLAGLENGTLLDWPLESSPRRLSTAHTDGIRQVAFLNDGTRALSVSPYQTILWDASTWRRLWTAISPENAGVWTWTMLSPDDADLLVGSWNELHRLDMATGEIRARISLPPGYGQVTVGTFSPDGAVVAVATPIAHDRRGLVPGAAILLLAPATGAPVRSCCEQPSRITSLLFAPDGHDLVVGGEDGEITTWHPGGGASTRFVGHNDGVRGLAVSNDGRLMVSGSLDGTMRLWRLKTGEEVMRLLSTRDGEWISSTPDGYYDRSPEGGGLLHYVRDPGGMETYAFEQFESVMRRPDVIAARLRGDWDRGKPAPALSLPPRLDMVGHMERREVVGATYTLNLTAAADTKLSAVRVFVNGRPTIERALDGREASLGLEVPLLSGPNRITAVAYDQRGFSSNPRMIDVESTQPRTSKPTLYVLAVGIGHYPGLPEDLQLHYAASDARAVEATLRRQQGRLFERVISTVLTDDAVTQAKVTNVLETLRDVEPGSVVCVYLAGHGLRDDHDRFHFMTADAHFDDPTRGSITWAELGATLRQSRGRVILFLDACHSGSVVTETVVPNDALAQEFFANSRGGIVVLSASKGRQPSEEGTRFGGGFGLFTWALTRGLGTDARIADSNGNGYVELMELADYIREVVDDESLGLQTPWMSRKEFFGDLPLADVNKPVPPPPTREAVSGTGGQ